MKGAAGMTTMSPDLPMKRTLATVLFTDAVGYSALANRDEFKAIELFAQDAATMTAVCSSYRGRVVKNTGDGLLMVFDSAVQAVNAAVEMQTLLYERRSPSGGEFFEHRIGIHLGDIVIGQEDVFGDGVNIASRLQNEALPGGIYMSQTVYDVVRGKSPISAVFMGPRSLKNIEQPVPAWQIPPIGATIDDLLPAASAEPGRSTLRQSVTARDRGSVRGRKMAWLLVLGGMIVVGWNLTVFAAEYVKSVRDFRVSRSQITLNKAFEVQGRNLAGAHILVFDQYGFQLGGPIQPHTMSEGPGNTARCQIVLRDKQLDHQLIRLAAQRCGDLTFLKRFLPIEKDPALIQVGSRTPDDAG